LHSALCAFTSFYGPLSCSMCHRPAMSHRSDLWTVNFFYVPSFCSMCFHLFLWTIILFYVPSPLSMCLHTLLWTVSPPYVPSALSTTLPVFPMSPPLHSNFKSLEIPNRIIKYHAYI